MKTPPKTIVFITGAFLSSSCWDEWKSFFESKGYYCVVPALPYKEASPEELRNRPPDDPIALTRLFDLMTYFITVIHGLPEKPILIGHSSGGLLVQLLLQRGSGIAGIAIHSFPPANVYSFRFAFVKAVCAAMALFTSGKKTYLVPFRTWKHAFANEMDCDQQKELYYKYAIPESKLVIRDTFKCRTKINFKNPHPPILFTSGGRDRLIPNSMNYINYRKYKNTLSITGYKNFRDHCHLVFDSTAWMEEAGYVHKWLQDISMLL